MPGAFDASPAFDHDPLATSEEIQRAGEDVLRWLVTLAESEKARPIDLYTVREIHFRWFETTFPADAGVERAVMVINRKSSAAPVESILPSVINACDNWEWRRANVAPHAENEEEARIAFAIAEANQLAVSIYDAHPFIDGNTRTTWHLRNYALMLDGIRPLVELEDEAQYEEAWWSATATNHAALDEAVTAELAAQELRS